MIKFKLVGLILILFTTISSCKEDNAASVSINHKVWAPALIDKNSSSNPSGQILYYAVLDCEKDDSYRFGTDGKLTINRGTNKCNNAELSTEVVNYTYNLSNKELIIKGVKYTVADESAVQLKYYTAIPNATGFQSLIFLFE
ncbi:hypothetical protein [Pedobacter cryophilus]|uniref:Lipocalin-like domain-containing protein n=1 Tax=Pedobacter cryophilus TaxID=2571271 RepID=A0A4V6WMV2_9SPHI|nr:hypothetical protein [Pedobacter cryophilus]TKB96203.1 hypothetical protein FA046_13525 [Pedobacter cryophilus]